MLYYTIMATSFLDSDVVEALSVAPLLLWLAVPVPVFVASLILFRRVGGKPLLLLLIGSTAYLLWQGIDLFLEFLGPFALKYHGSWFIQRVWPGCTPDRAFDIAVQILRAISLCFPVGFIWFALRSTRRT